MCDAIQFAEDTHLHFLGRLVGERDGEDGAICHRVLDDERHVFLG